MTLEPMQTALTRSLRQTLAISPPIRSYFSCGSSSSSSSSSFSSSSSEESASGRPSSGGTGGDVVGVASGEGESVDIGGIGGIGDDG